MKIMRPFLKTFKIICIVVLAAVLLFNAINIFKRVILKEQMPLVFGYGNAVIITGSMEPEIMPGDIVTVRKQRDYAVGEIVTYQGNNNFITHRIMEKTPDGYITQGDANNTDDGEISKSRVIGRVVIVIPKIGNLILFFKSPLGMLILIFALFAIIEMPRFIEKIRKEDDRRDRNEKYLRR